MDGSWRVAKILLYLMFMLLASRRINSDHDICYRCLSVIMWWQIFVSVVIWMSFILSRKEEYCGLISRRMEIDIFNGFIEDNFLVDLSFHGRRFTWYLSDGQSMSRLYQFLLSKEWCLAWPNCVQVAQ